jgi:hypothetical protein
MVSYVLHNAVREIDLYLEEFPVLSTEYHADILRVRAAPDHVIQLQMWNRNAEPAHVHA